MRCCNRLKHLGIVASAKKGCGDSCALWDDDRKGCANMSTDPAAWPGPHWFTNLLRFIRAAMILGLSYWDSPRLIMIVTIEHLYIFVFAYTKLLQMTPPLRRPKRARFIGGRRRGVFRHRIIHRTRFHVRSRKHARRRRIARRQARRKIPRQQKRQLWKTVARHVGKSWTHAVRVGEAKNPGPQWRQGDWRCPACGDQQFARNRVCRRCNEPKPMHPNAAQAEEIAPQFIPSHTK